MLYKARNEDIKFLDDSCSMISEAKAEVKATKGTGLKILTPKQMLQKLPKLLHKKKQAVTQKVY